ncbi:MAG: DoxX family protein [Saprospiraceae bacterium]|nr:DoxX family protein [Saprospiraceae bacterium]
MYVFSTLSSLFWGNTTRLLRWAIGINYFWFGMLKFFQGWSPAETLAQDTIRIITFGLIPDDVNLLLLAIWEVGIGLIFFSGYLTRFGAKAAIVHMIFTFTPLFFFPHVAFAHAPFGFTIVGQYIVKNLVFWVALGIILKEENEKALQRDQRRTHP